MSSNLPNFNLCEYFLGEDRLIEIGPRKAIEYCGNHITYTELRRLVDHWTRRIRDKGVGEGDRVALLVYDSPDFIASFLATLALGAISVPINTFLAPDQIGFILLDSASRLVIAESELSWKIDQDREESKDGIDILSIDSSGGKEVEPDDGNARGLEVAETTRESAAFLLYTSGSTGTPKGVLHRHGAIPVTVDCYEKHILGLAAEDRCYSASRLFFAYGLGNSLSFPLSRGATVLLDRERPTAERIAGLFEREAPTVFFGVPAIYRSLLEFCEQGGRVETSSLRLCISAGEALPQKILADWQESFGLDICEGIGSTEMLHIFISNRRGGARAASSGKVVEGYETRLLDDSGRESGASEYGHLWVRGASAMVGYWNLPELTDETIREGWVRTGDIFQRDDEGYFYHIGRSDDCFKVRGLWVSPIEVESELLAHESIIEAAVVVSKEESGLATVKAYVVIRQDRAREALKEELREFLKTRLPQYKVPSQIEYLRELPRTSTGKIERYRLRAESRENHAGGSNEH